MSISTEKMTQMKNFRDGDKLILKMLSPEKAFTIRFLLGTRMEIARRLMEGNVWRQRHWKFEHFHSEFWGYVRKFIWNFKILGTLELMKAGFCPDEFLARDRTKGPCGSEGRWFEFGKGFHWYKLSEFFCLHNLFFSDR